MLMGQGGCPAPREEEEESCATISSLPPGWNRQGMKP